RPGPKAITSVAFSPDGGRLAFCQNWDVTAWDLGRNEKCFTKENVGSAAVYSADGLTLATAAFGLTETGHYVGRVSLFDAGAGDHLRDLDYAPGLFTCLVASPDGRHVAAGVQVGGGAAVGVWDTANDQVERIFILESQAVFGVALSPDGQRLASPNGGYGTPAEVKVWDVQSGDELLSLRGHEAPVVGLAYSADGRRLVTVSDDQTLKVWDAHTGAELLSRRAPGRAFSSVAFSPDGRCIAA